MKTQIRQSRWVKLPALLSVEGMVSLFETLGPVVIARTGVVLSLEEVFISQGAFLEVYRAYIEALQEGKEPHLKSARPFFSTTWSVHAASFKLQEVGSGAVIAHVIEPCIQLRLHGLSYSPLDHSFHSMSLGRETIAWGVQFAYASLIQEGASIRAVDPTALNTQLFRKLQRWIRHETEPVVFCGDGWETRTAARLSPACLGWIGKHPGLEGLQVKGEA